MKIPASYHQERLWFIDTFEAGNLYPSSPVYHNIPILLTITGPMNPQVLEQSIQEVIRRHEALRTHIITVDNKPIQSINTSVEFHLMVSEITDNTLNNEQTEPVALAIEESKRPFLMDKEPLIRARLFQINNSRKKNKTNKESLLLITLHHSIADNYSLGILIREMLAFYNSHLEGDEPRLPQLSIQYADFSHWQRQMPAAALKSLLRYWKGQLKGGLQPLEVPTDRVRAAVHIFHAARQTFTLVEPTVGAVRTFAQQQGVSKEVLLLAVFKILLHRYSGQEEVVVGISAENRTQPGTETIIGPIANLLAIRTLITGKSQFHTILSKINRTVREALKYQSMPFDRLVMEINPHKDMSRTALFDVLFQYEENPFELPEVKDLKIERVETNLGWGKYDLNLMIQNKEEEKSFTGIMVYNSDYYDDAIIERLICHYKILLENLLKEPHQSIDTVSLLSEEEQYQLVSQWNQTEADFPTEKTIHQVFEGQVEKAGDKIAVVGMEHGAWSMASLTYVELDEKSNQITHLLREKGVRADTIVAVILGRSPWMIAVLLGILKAGGAYLPIDPEYPEERIRYILADSAAKILLTSRDNIPVGAGKQGGLAPLSVGPPSIAIVPLYLPIEDLLAACPEEQPATRSLNLAYIIYTSGTTGRPKGCTISHKNVLRLLTNNRQPVVFNNDEVWVMAHSYCFDFSVWEMYGALLCGGRLVIPPRQTVRDTAAFLALVKQYNVTVLNQTPAAFYNLIAEEQKSEAKILDRHLRMVIFGGDKLEPAYLKSWAEMYPLSRVHLINMYGITETTIHVTHYTLRDEDITAPAALSPIGVPLPETTVYIFNAYLQLQPALVTGEIYVGGSGVSRGYLNNSKLTHSRFLENPYKAGEILYRTGDLGRWLPDGSIQYVGRIDHQVQLRGFRIEMGEIEIQLLRHEHIKEAVVTARGKGRDKYLCAYIVPHTSSPPTAGELRSYLSNTLPDYMIPSFFVVMAKIPLTSNGKVDRKSLPEPDVVSTEGEYTAPRDGVEEQLEKIWSEVLDIRRDALHESRKIGIDANFFELGGHSLKAAALVSRIHKAFNVKMPFAELFVTPTIRALADYIKKRQKTTDLYTIIDAVEKKEFYPLSSVQKRLYILQQMDPEGTGYNNPALMKLDGELQIEKLEETFRKLIARHESLRTSFHMVNEKPVQKLHKEVNFRIEFYDLVRAQVEVGIEVKVEESPHSPHSSHSPDSPLHFIKRFVRPFDLSQAPLLRVGIIKTGEESHILMVDMHHVITDGTSIGLLVKEFMALYSGKELPPLRIHYKDYTLCQNSEKEEEALKKQEKWWIKEFSEEIPVLNLPLDYVRPAFQSLEGSRMVFESGPEELEALNKVALEEGTTLYMVLLAVYSILLSKLCGQEEIVVGTPVAGRRDPDLELIIGMFVNTLTIRTHPEGDKSFKEFLGETKEKTLEAFENQGYPFEDLVEQVAVNRDTGRNPIFDVFFILQNIEIPVVKIPGLKLEPYPFDSKISKFDLTLQAIEIGASDIEQKLKFTMEYSTRLFKSETIERFIDCFRQILLVVLKEPGEKISQIDIISEEEKRQVLYEFNDTHTQYPKDKTIHQLFEEQVEREGHNIALVGSSYHVETNGRFIASGTRTPHVHITYRELNQKSNELAFILRNRGVKPDTIVGIMVERSVEMAIGVLGILKAGGAYLPIDPDYPEERIRYMLADSAAKILISAGLMLGGVSMGVHIDSCRDEWPIYRVRETGQGLKQISTDRKQSGRDKSRPYMINAKNLAYVIYTSGSTGKPKGVVVEHGSTVNVLAALFNRYPITETDVYLLKTSFVFDVSITELFGWFWGGGRMVILGRDEHKDPTAIINAIETSKVTHINFVPAMFNAFVDALNAENIGRLSSLKYIFLAGEALVPELINKFRQLGVNIPLENLYGPTEGTVYASGYSIDQWDGRSNIPIGSPLQNMALYILGTENHLQPVGICGELCIAGAGVARGYLNNPEFTPERFPLIRDNIQEGTVGLAPLVGAPHSNGNLYRTGDLCRWQPDGNIEFFGRIDRQIKIRGFRVELGEIENRLLAHESVKEVVVMDREDENGDKYLCAYIVYADVKAFEKMPKTRSTELKEYLSQMLPDYMIPSYIVPLEAIPLTPNGKVDRRVLPEPRIDAAAGYIAPGNALEAELANIWAEILGMEKDLISVNTNIFELGGNSLKIINVTRKLKEIFNWEIPVVTMFRHSTILSLAQYLHQTQIQIPTQPTQTTQMQDVHYEKDRSKTLDEGRARMAETLRKMKRRGDVEIYGRETKNGTKRST